MRGFLASFAAVAAVLATSPAWALLAPATAWVPTIDAVRHVESKVNLPDGAKSMGAYVRFYTGVVENGRKVIEGVYLVRAVVEDMHRTVHGDVNIVAARDMPFINDGGCLMVTVYFDVASDAITRIRCNGYA